MPCERSYRQSEVPHTLDSVPVPLVAIYGDPIVGRVLVLLLRSSRYNAKFLPDLSLIEPGMLEDVELLLLCPSLVLDPKRRETLLASLRAKIGAFKTSIIELVGITQETRSDQGQGGGSIQTVHWPCTIQELERQIEAALLATTPEASRITR